MTTIHSSGHPLPVSPFGPTAKLLECADMLDALALDLDGHPLDVVCTVRQTLVSVAGRLSDAHPDAGWHWEEAFDKFGFEDGDGVVMTDLVAVALCAGGYLVTTQKWGLHNTVITSIRSPQGREQIPDGTKLAYDPPRGYLPPAILKLLDRAFPHRYA